MILYFSFNVNEIDTSGLPYYSRMFLQNKKDNIFVINIIADPSADEKVIQKSENWIDFHLPRFLEVYYQSLEMAIREIVQTLEIKKVIMPDYLLQPYIENIPMQNIQKILFIHLLYRGMLDRFTKEPYFEQHLLTGISGMAMNAWIEWKAISMADVIICNSSFTENELIKYYSDTGIFKKDVYTVPLGIDHSNVPFLPNNNSKRWAFFGRLEVQKGIFYLFKDWSTYEEKYQNNPLVVCGEGFMSGNFYKAEKYDKLIEYHGECQKDKLYEVLAGVKYCIFPSIYEPYGLALDEALAMGKICIISSKPSGMLDRIHHGVNGFVFDFQHESIVNYIDFLESQHYDFDLLSCNARKSVNCFSKHQEKIFEILEGKSGSCS